MIGVCSAIHAYIRIAGIIRAATPRFKKKMSKIQASET